MVRSPDDLALCRESISRSLTHTACAVIAQGLGVSIVDPPTVEDCAGKGLVARPLSVRIDTGFLVIRSSKSTQQGLTGEFSIPQLLQNLRGAWRGGGRCPDPAVPTESFEMSRSKDSFG